MIPGFGVKRIQIWQRTLLKASEPQLQSQEPYLNHAMLRIFMD
jgi:hypothetical protein